MPSGRSPARLFSNADVEQLLRLSREGKSVAVIADTLEFSPGTIYRHLKQDDELREQWREAQALGRQIKGDNAESVIEEIQNDPRHKDRLRAAIKMAEVYNEDFRQAQRIEISGGDPIRVEVESTDDEAARILHVLAGAGLLALRAQGSPDTETYALHPAPTE